ncbi:polyphosphate kinase 1 [Halohasta litorea]|uniref:Polyphosphate kinase n=1 Tax=Halohasta litorea TaxID=869891 RepID=A0ABD6D6B5_9EURY
MHSEESDIPTDQPSKTDDSPIDLSPSTWRTDSRPRTPPIAKSGDTNGHTAVEWEAIRDGTAGTGDELANPAAYLNRELSELSFQWRVLYEALDDENPPLERLKFLAILTKNMDEFFMKRIGGLKQQIDAEVTDETVDGRAPHEQWGEALEFARPIFETQSRCYHEAVKPALADNGIEIVDYESLSGEETAALRSYFERAVLPTLTPLTFDPAHPFPFISNLSLSLAVLSVDDDGTKKFSRVKLPENRPRLVPVSATDEQPVVPDDDTAVSHADGGRFVRLESVIAANIDLLFPNVEVLDCSTFRVTRNAEVRRNEEVAEGLIEMIEDVLRQRRFATVVRVEVDADMPSEVRSLLVDQLEITERELFERPEPLGFQDFFRLLELDTDALTLPSWEPQPHPRFLGHDSDRPDDLFGEIADDDILVHHPYHSFTNTVQTFLDTAAHDPDTLAIKVAIYRTAPDSQVIQSLIEAAKNGKQVAVMVELKARFDEENNLRWVKRLEEEGIHVTYGTIGLKTHSKVALAVRDEGETDDVELYSHIATGNYHSETAKSYEDLGLFTDDRDIGQDLVQLFNSFTGHSQHESYRKLLVAPETLRDRMTDLIRREADHARAGHGGRIVAKMNALEDPDIVRELYAASQAGVDIDLIVRGICRLRPGIDGLSETIRVHSVVGRFLEHSRIFKFGNAGEPEYYIGSADWMTRNLDRRVEAVTPVENATLQDELDRILDSLLGDNRKRWEMDATGRYVQQRPGDGPQQIAHEQLMQRARQAVPDTPTEYETAEPDQRETAVDLDDVYLEEPFDQ